MERLEAILEGEPFEMDDAIATKWEAKAEILRRRKLKKS
jgi:hypothetical protein